MNNRTRSTVPELFNAVISDYSYSNYGETMTEMIMAKNTDSTQPTLTNDVVKLQTHIPFLQQCAKSCKMLEKVNMLSLTTNFVSATSTSTSRMVDLPALKIMA